MRKILVTTDLSANSKSGLRFAIQLANQIPCKLVFYNIFVGIENNVWNTGEETSMHDIRLEKLQKFIKEVYNQCQITPPKKLNCVVEAGIDISNVILHYAKENKCDYICIGTRGGGVLEKILGSNTSTLIRHSSIPVLVIPKRYRLKPINEIWYSSDLANIKSELAIVKKIAKSLNSEIHIYHYDYLAEIDEVRAKLNKIALKHISQGIYFHFRKMEIENTISQLLQKDINKHKPSLVILFTKQHKTWYDRFFLPNNTKEITFDTQIPLLILKKSLV